MCFLLVFHLSFLWCAFYLLGTGLGDGKGKLATCRHRADSGGEKVKKCTSP